VLVKPPAVVPAPSPAEPPLPAIGTHMPAMHIPAQGADCCVNPHAPPSQVGVV
jgi:hypothetical protein